MRLGTKILLLTLGLVVALTAAVLGVVRERVRSQEVAQTTASIHRAVGEYFERLDAAAENAHRVAGLLFGEPGARSVLSNLNQSGAIKEDDAAAVQFRNYIFVETGHRELPVRLASGTKVPPAFHVLFSERGDRLASIAPDDPKLDSAVRDAAVPWPIDDLIDGKVRQTTRYALIAGELFFVIGVPISTSARIDDPPTNAYFIGYRVDDRWAEGFLGQESGEAGATPLGVWFVRGADRPFVIGGDAIEPGDSRKQVGEVFASGRDLSVGAAPMQARIGIASEVLLAEVVAYEPAAGERLVLAVTASLEKALAPMNRLLRTITLVGAGAIVIAYLACRWIARRIARPIGALVEESERIGRGDFDVKVDTTRKDELGDLARGFTHMAKGLAQRDFIKDTFGKFVDPSVVATLIADPKRLRPGGEQRVQTVLMSDVANFTRLGEKLTPEQLVLLLNEYLGACADIVANEKGVVDKFIGDAVVAFWGPPLTDDHAERACWAALRMADAAASMNARCAALGVAPLKVRIGIATGEMIVGNIGSPSKFNYTVMGDVVNLCARLEGVNKLYSTTILATRATAQSLGAGWVWRELDVVRVVGRGAGEPIVEIMAAPSPASADTTGKDELRRDRFVAARAHYLRREWPRAREAFEALAREFPADNAAAAMALRCARLEAIPPEPDWDGVWTLDVK